MGGRRRETVVKRLKHTYEKSLSVENLSKGSIDWRTIRRAVIEKKEEEYYGQDYQQESVRPVLLTRKSPHRE